MSHHKKTLPGLMLVAAIVMSGCDQTATPPNQNSGEPTLIEEISVNGFDPDGEPVIKKWSDGSLWIHFEAMPPFFAEDDGTEQDFENFETRIQEALGVAVQRDVREVFVIKKPNPDTAEKAKTWLESYRRDGA
jgi:hypothetical protein